MREADERGEGMVKARMTSREEIESRRVLLIDFTMNIMLKVVK